MSTLDVEKNNSAPRYDSITDLKEHHTGLLNRYKEGLTEKLLDDLETFMRRAAATGALLDNENDRRASQSMVDYWMTVLYREDRTPPDSTLAEFDPSLSPKLDDSRCPYRGLNAFQEEDRDLFFGRHRMIELAVQKINEARLLFLVGPSGSGKSSLALAGLVPALKDGILPGSKDWQYFPQIVPGRDPIRSLVSSLNKVYNQTREWEARQVELLKHDPDHLLDIVSRFAPAPAVIVVDQFEELFTLCTDDRLRDAFINSLISLAEAADTPHLVILTLRTDFETYLVQHPALMSLFERGELRVTPLSATDLRNAIEKPAKLIGLKFEDGVVDALVRDILGEPEGLPLLQFTLLRLWRMREDGRSRITLRQYRKLVGARQALALTADEFYQSLLPEDQITVRRILLKLALPSGNAEVLRNPVKRESLYFESPDRVDKVLNKLYEAGLVRITKGDTAAADKVEVAHEALVRNWPRLVDWIEKKRVSMRQRRRLTMAAEQWLEHNKDAGSLLGGSVLAEALQYDDLNDLEKAFVRASRGAVEQAEREKDAARRREQELERANAKKLRMYVRLLVILTIIAIGTAATATIQARRASVSEDLAIKRWQIAEVREREREEAVRDAIAAKNTADSERQTAEEERRRAEEQTKIARDERIRADKASKKFAESTSRHLRDEIAKTKLAAARTDLEKHRREVDAKFGKQPLEASIIDFDRLREESGKAQDPLSEGHALSQLSIAYKMRGDRNKSQPGMPTAGNDYARSSDLYKQAEQVFKRTLVEKMRDAKTKIDAMAALLHLIQFYKDHGRTSELEDLYNVALEIQEGALRNDEALRQKEYDELVDTMTEFYTSQSKPQQLEGLYRRVIDTKRRVYDPARPLGLYSSFLKLADFYRKRGDFTRAANTYEEALSLIQPLAEKGDPDISRVLVEALNNLGDFYQSQGYFSGAENYYAQALDNHKKKPSPESRDDEVLASIYSNLGDVQKNQYDFDRALENYQEAIRIYSGNFKKNDRSLAASARAAADILLSRRNYAEAERYLKQAVEVLGGGDDRPKSIEWTNAQIKLARINYIYSVGADSGESGKYHAAAVDHIKKALSVARPPLTTLDSELREQLKWLQDGASKVGDGSEPERAFDELLRVYYEGIEGTGPLYAMEAWGMIDEFIGKLGEAYPHRGNAYKMIGFYKQVLEIRKRTSGKIDPSRLYSTYNELGQIYFSLAKYADAEDNYLEALKLVEGRYGQPGVEDKNLAVAKSLNNLAAVYRERGKYTKAEEYYKRAQSNLKEKGKQESTRMVEALEGHAEVLRDTGRAAEASGLREEAQNILNRLDNVKE